MKRPFPFHSNAVWPSPVLAGTFIVAYGFVSACFWLIELSVPGNTAAISNMPEVINFHTSILGVAAAIFAAFRLLRFHPACNRAYATWLKLSPWTPDKPLPAGPVHLVWQDALVVGVLTAVAYWDHVNALLPVTVFILVYLAGFTFLLAFTRQSGPCLILGFLWPVLILPEAKGLPSLGILAAIACTIWYGHKQSLKAFPWDFIKAAPRSLLNAEIRIGGLGTSSAAGTQFNLGWPFLALSPKVRPPSVSQRTSVALGALAGWWSFCIIRGSGMDPLPEFVLFFAIFAAFIRVGVYRSGVVAPFNIWGRIVTGRIVVPGYDKVYVTPLAVVVLGVVACIVIKRSGAWYPVGESVMMAVIWSVLFSGGPTLRNWALTGLFRLRPPAMVNANKQTIRPV